MEQQRLPSLIDPPILFAHRGARAHAPENTIEAFELAIRLGATGLESDVWVTADGVPVLDHDGTIRISRLRSRPISEIESTSLPDHIPTLEHMLRACVLPSRVPLSLDLKAETAFAPTIDAINRVDPSLADVVWICHHDVRVLEMLRENCGSVRLVDSTRLDRISEGPERRAARLSAAGIEAINMHRQDWNGGLVTLAHRFGLKAFSWDLQHEHQLRPALRMGIDAVYSDHVDRMVDAARLESML